MQESSFLPKDYKAPVSGGGFMKLQDGDNVFRVLSSAITGFEYWNTESKPVRSHGAVEGTPADIKLDKEGNPTKVKHFWAFVVWNYATKSVEILQLNQSSIQSAIGNLVSDVDWGDPKGYDIKVTRSGTGMETEYAVSPKPHKEVSEEVTKAFADKKINLDALYTGANPFA